MTHRATASPIAGYSPYFNKIAPVQEETDHIKLLLLSKQ